MKVEELCEYGFLLRPFEREWEVTPPKSYALCLFSLIHGNEVGGLAVLNEFLALLASGLIDCRISLVVALGNPWAAKKGERFLERDLNRSFGRSGPTWEEKRALALSPLLDNCMWFLDLHQTSQPSVTPFFIFPYSKEGLLFAENLSASTPIVTHWDHGFSEDGMCSDEFVIEKGGVGITLESGQSGFDNLQIGFGVKTALQALHFVTSMLREDTPPHTPSPERRNIYILKETVLCPQEGELKLNPGLISFQKIEKGTLLGIHEGNNIVSPASGYLLFPNYNAERRPPHQRPMELMRIIEEIDTSALP